MGVHFYLANTSIWVDAPFTHMIALLGELQLSLNRASHFLRDPLDLVQRLCWQTDETTKNQSDFSGHNEQLGCKGAAVSAHSLLHQWKIVWLPRMKELPSAVRAQTWTRRKRKRNRFCELQQIAEACSEQEPSGKDSRSVAKHNACNCEVLSQWPIIVCTQHNVSSNCHCLVKASYANTTGVFGDGEFRACFESLPCFSTGSRTQMQRNRQAWGKGRAQSHRGCNPSPDVVLVLRH